MSPTIHNENRTKGKYRTLVLLLGVLVALVIGLSVSASSLNIVEVQHEIGQDSNFLTLLRQLKIQAHHLVSLLTI